MPLEQLARQGGQVETAADAGVVRHRRELRHGERDAHLGFTGGHDATEQRSRDLESAILPRHEAGPQAPAGVDDVEVGAHLLVTDQGDARLAAQAIPRRGARAEDLQRGEMEREDDEAVLQVLGDPQTDHLPGLIEQDRIGHARLPGARAEERSRFEGHDRRLGAVGPPAIHRGDAPECGAVEHPFLIDPLLRPAGRPLALERQRLHRRRLRVGGAKQDGALDQRLRGGGRCFVENLHPHLVSRGLLDPARLQTQRDPSLVEDDPAVRLHVLHADEDQAGGQDRGRLRQHLHAHRQRHDRQPGQVGVGGGHLPAERVVAQKCVFVEAERPAGHQLFAGAQADDGVDQRHPRERGRRL